MRSSETLTLPTAQHEYKRTDEEQNRRTIIQAYQALRNDVVDVRDTSEPSSSLALRRHQFLLMGA
jgi:hypothetical protein